MSGGYGFGLRRLLLFLLVIATIFALVDNGYGGGGCGYGYDC
ncbi:hypothetical protein [Salinithrix halophila]|uniref:Sporulation protein YjcZ n=1 Tax=Salinithrix halophila TaxID=1485204 RepID=A0ABV8JK19_9BACL